MALSTELANLVSRWPKTSVLQKLTFDLRKCSFYAKIKLEEPETSSSSQKDFTSFENPSISSHVFLNFNGLFAA